MVCIAFESRYPVTQDEACRGREGEQLVLAAWQGEWARPKPCLLH
jgi:hypothetical protein